MGSSQVAVVAIPMLTQEGQDMETVATGYSVAVAMVVWIGWM